MLQVLFGPMVQLYPPGHPLDPERRDGLNGPEFARAITIGDDCWVGGGAVIMGEREQCAVALKDVWQVDITGVARFTDACSERVYTSAGPPVGDQASDQP